MTTEPRWADHAHVNSQAPGREPWEFCEQVGDLDVWISPSSVLPINPKGDGHILAYQHAVLKFPRIAEKMVAMRTFLWGE